MLSNKTFLNLIEDGTILVPVIQRDYAQGRNDEKSAQIRDNFLTALVDQLCDHKKTKPLILDFVYGSLNGAESKEEKTQFLPLDGQQRLTTLFLLHWYLTDDKELLYNNVNGVVRSKFSYQTRLSSKEFCDRLVEYSIDELQGAKSLLSEKIKDQSWYRWDWSKDPTIDGMLVMLDAIDERLKELNKEDLWCRLKEGCVGFNLLYLDEFSLSDELYVKMNARGKELSEFDILKSTLEEQMRLNEVPEQVQTDWRTNVDSCWIDLFWNIAKEKIGSGDKKEDVIVNVEQAYLRFVQRLFVYHLFINDNCLKNLDRQDVIRELKRLGLYNETNTDTELIDKIRKFSVENDALRLLNVFCKTGFFDALFFQFGLDVFNGIIFNRDDRRFDISTLINGIVFENNSPTLFGAFTAPKISYADRVQFFALIQFALYHPAQEIAGNLAMQVEFNQWMRVIRNLSTNSNSYMYNTYKDFYNSISTIKEWATAIYGKEGNEEKEGKDINSIVTFLSRATATVLTGFTEDQLSEEIMKAQLFSVANWEQAIRQAEEHPYFLGQIRFLLDWSGNDVNAFQEYTHKLELLFDEKGLRIDENEFRCAMLCLGDYCLDYGYGKSLLSNGKERDRSWKRFLRDKEKVILLKELLDRYSPQSQTFEQFFAELKEKQLPTDWRQYFILNPKIINLLEYKKISWWVYACDEIILFYRERASAKHWELRTYYWYELFKKDTDTYFSSKDEDRTFTATFYRDKGEISIQFVPRWKDGWEEGDYILSCNFDPEIPPMTLCDNGHWEYSVKSKQAPDIELLLKDILSRS